MPFDWTDILSATALLTAVGGAITGVLWGALPGLSVNMVMALLIGITYSFSAELAIVFLLAAWIAAEFGGAIPAISINIPGTPAAIPAQMAGYPLALEGRGGEAIGAALYSSVAGGFVGCLFLFLVAPLLTRIILHIGSWELFLLAMIGVMLSGQLAARDAPLKGFAMGLFGLLISMIGQEPLFAVNRWTLDSPELLDGIQFVPVVIGLFAISEVLAGVRRSPNGQQELPAGRISWPRGYLGRHASSILRSSLLGTVIGSLPGAGGNVASLVSYTAGEKRTGRDFSRGDIEGVICGEVANNSNVGGGLVPTITLGVPGNNSSALFMAALAVHGVAVGPAVGFDHPGLLAYLVAALVIANLALLISGPMASNIAQKALTIPQYLLMPMVLVLAIMGTYAATQSIFNLYIMTLAGALGWILRRGGFPLAPLVLGLVLGPIADENLRRAILLEDGNWLLIVMRPAGLTICAAVLGIYVVSYWLQKR